MGLLRYGTARNPFGGPVTETVVVRHPSVLSAGAVILIDAA
jgi:hypothetical protein